MNDVAGPFDADQIRAHSFLRHVELHESLPSTNDRAIQLAGVAGLETPALVLARRQTAGRGRGASRWWSPDGALTISLIVDSAELGLTTRDWPRLSLTTAVAVCDALPVDCSIKWPNDVLIDGRKVCGILIESPGGAAPAKDRLIIGVGINVNNSWRDAPPEVGAAGAALCDATGRQHDLQRVLIGFLLALGHRLQQLAGGNKELPLAWQARSSLTDRRVAVDCGGRRTTGRCLGIADDGALIVETGSKAERIYSGSVLPIG